MSVYFDNAATTPIKKEVQEEMIKWMDHYGNPSSLYEIGYETAEKIEEARNICARAINAEPEEIIFTSGGSEANNLALKGFYGRNIPDRTVVTSTIEHHSVLNAVKYIGLCLYGNVYYIDCQLDGVVWWKDIEFYCKNYSPKIVSIMGVNNELGAINDIERMGEICGYYNAIFHVDAVQMFPHIKIDVKKMNINTMSVSAHKFGGPKGSGFLYVNKNIQHLMHPLIHGGQQEHGLRGGTENIVGIIGLAKAVEILERDREESEAKIKSVSDYFQERIEEIKGVRLNSNIHKVPGILNYSFRGVNAEELRELLNQNHVYCSSGSACDSKSGKPSHVLTAIGLTEEEANSSLRFSFSADNTKEEVDYAVKVIIAGLSLLST